MSECVLSTRAPMSTGYTQLLHKGKLVYSHRLAYAQAHGLDVFNMPGFVLHSCDNRLCYNPEHLRLGTAKDNMDDKVSRGRQTKGTATAFGVLTDKDRLYIRKHYRKRSKGVCSNVYELATKFNVTFSSIYRVVNGEYSK